MSLSTATDWRSLHQILSQRPPKKETSYTSSSQRIFSKSEERITPQRDPRENKAALPLCALTHWKLIHTVWSYLWHQYNMMQTRRRGIQAMLKALQRFLTLHKLLLFHQVSLLFIPCLGCIALLLSAFFCTGCMSFGPKIVSSYADIRFHLPSSFPFSAALSFSFICPVTPSSFFCLAPTLTFLTFLLIPSCPT